MEYYTYIVICSDATYYTGACLDIQKRIHEHNEGKQGAKYTRSRRPVSLVYSETHTSWSDACKREWEIKQMTRKQKEELFL